MEGSHIANKEWALLLICNKQQKTMGNARPQITHMDKIHISVKHCCFEANVVKAHYFI